MPAIAVEIRTVLNPIGLLLQRSPRPRARRALRWIPPAMRTGFERDAPRSKRGVSPIGNTVVAPMRIHRRAGRESAGSTNAAPGTPVASTPGPYDMGAERGVTAAGHRWATRSPPRSFVPGEGRVNPCVGARTRPCRFDAGVRGTMMNGRTFLGEGTARDQGSGFHIRSIPDPESARRPGWGQCCAAPRSIGKTAFALHAG